MGGNCAVHMVSGTPQPSIHDEFSYLLAADTFASGRLTNPTHPHWQHFETFHVLHEPTYQSKYPPGQGLVLALGQVATGDPIAGVWLSIGLMTAAIAWMLLNWLPPHWGILTALVCTVQLGWLSYWAHSYWGGAVAAAGGALVFGALRASWGRGRVFYGFLLGSGLGVLAASRPFEGAVAGMAAALAVCARLRSRADRAEYASTVLVPAVLVAGTALAALGYYNWRVTGSALEMPYRVYQRQYSASATFLFQEPRPAPAYRHAEIERFWKEFGAQRHLNQQSLRAQLGLVPSKLGMMVFTFLGVGAIGLSGVPGAARRRSWTRFAVAAAGAVIIAALMTKASWPHYVAPAAALIYVALGAGLSHLHYRSRTRGTINLAIVVIVALGVFAPIHLSRILTAEPGRFADERSRIRSDLESLPRRSLVIVSYPQSHNYMEEWVYNDGMIDDAKVVWARSMGETRDRGLIDYFDDRAVWRLSFEDGPRLAPYPH
jgi:hypothetical protein